MYKRLSPQKVADSIIAYGNKEQISKAIQEYYRNKPTSETQLALISVFSKSDVLGAWKLFNQFSPSPHPLLSNLSNAHYKKHPHYLRDNIKFAGITEIDKPTSILMSSCILSKVPLVAIDLYEQASTFKKTELCDHAAIKAYSITGNLEKTKMLWEKGVKRHECYAKLLKNEEVLNFFNEVPVKERSDKLFDVVLQKLSGDDYQRVGQALIESGFIPKEHTPAAKAFYDKIKM